MIQVSVTRNEHIDEIIVKDHAEYADSGEDLVCAGASSITVGMMNALDELMPCACDLEIKESYTRIKVKSSSDKVEWLLEALLIQLKTLEEAYSSYIKITEQEV